jgi:4-alpha-glucanotransferase
MPISALPSRYGIGDLGPEAVKFAEFLKSAGQSVWQVLPLTTVDGASGNSPYSPASAFAGNPLLISPEALFSAGLLERSDVDNAPAFPRGRVDYDLVREFSDDVLRRAWANFKAAVRNGGGAMKTDYDLFFSANRYWLEPWSFFAAIKEKQGGKSWVKWPDDLKYRRNGALHAVWERDSDRVEYHRFVQFLFHRQMAELRECLDQFEIELVGDVPIYMTLDSADVWANPQLFELDADMAPTALAGVPPDYFSKTGQLWGNPLYRWSAMEAEGFRWWISRLRHMLAYFDVLRLDHFRGLIGYWAVPAGETTAEKGCWRGVPHERFFERLCWEFPNHPFWAENLGILTNDIETARRGMGLPGMLILQFAFGDPSANPYAPHNHTPDNVVYTGTHDNNTTRGWFEEEAEPKEVSNLILYLGKEVNAGTICDDMTRMAMSSVADTCVIPMQDHLALGAESRTNVPSTPSGNWEWRMTPGQATKVMASRLAALTKLYGRLPPARIKA